MVQGVPLVLLAGDSPWDKGCMWDDFQMCLIKRTLLQVNNSIASPALLGIGILG